MKRLFRTLAFGSLVGAAVPPTLDSSKYSITGAWKHPSGRPVSPVAPVPPVKPAHITQTCGSAVTVTGRIWHKCDSAHNREQPRASVLST